MQFRPGYVIISAIMGEERRQQELFEFEQPKKRFRGLSEIFKKAGLDGSTFAVTLKMDKMVFLSIAVIMLMVVVYALGVERGRSTPARHTQEPAQASIKIPAAPVKIPETITPQTAAQAAVSDKTPGTVKDSVKPYTIAVASLSKKDTALSEVARMKNNGFDSFIIYSQPYYVVCVGMFADKTSAVSQRELLRVRRFCKDAYFRAK